ncbi:MarR family winged helix-turn-helix transcriptional regulator [Aliihoeflea sp. PC F10.4]
MKKLTDMPGHLARRFQQTAVAVFAVEMKKTGHDLTPVQYAALVTLFEKPGIDQATLAGLIAYDRTTIGGVVDRLVRKGLVRREVGTDRRARILDLTEEGNGALNAVSTAVETAQSVILGGLEPGERDELMRLLGKAIASLNDYSRAQPFVP